MAKLKEKLYDKLQEWRPRTARLLNEYGNTVVDQITIGQIIGGMRDHQKGKATSTNPIASIYAWTRGLAHRAKLDENPQLLLFCDTLEQVCVETVQAGIMTKDLALLIHNEELESSHYLHTEPFLDAIKGRLDVALKNHNIL